VPRSSARSQRLLALGADGADILHRLGVWPQVVGVTAFYRQPANAEPKPRVSGFSSGNLDAILGLKPDLVITSTDVQHRLAADLIKAGVNVGAMNTRCLAEIYDATSASSSAARTKRSAWSPRWKVRSSP
jgi:iron complex transport system substrate-binding protein